MSGDLKSGIRPIGLIEFASTLGGVPKDIPADAQFTGFALDSRNAKPGDLFLAIKGANADGHEFTRQASDNGAAATIAEREVPGPHILVPNLVDALAKMAVHYRGFFKGPVVGVTGSVGKTTTKEFIAAALSPLGRIAKTEGNRNTEYTAPLLWPALHGDERAAVVEMGMRGFGQIRHLAYFAKPTVGVVTNIGYTHLELVGSREGIAFAKAELFEALPLDGLAVAPTGDDYLGVLRAQAKCPLETFGFHSGDARVGSYRAVSWQESRVEFVVHGQTVAAAIPAPGRHMALNAAAALLVAAHCGVNLEEAALKLREAQMPALRMQVVEAGGAKIVLDSYNAAPASFKAALESLAELPCEGSRLVVMGEMRELGAALESAHREVGRMIAASNVARACFVGEATRFAREECLIAGMSEDSLTEAKGIEDVRAFVAGAMPGDTILIKGSRALELERALPQGAPEVAPR